MEGSSSGPRFLVSCKYNPYLVIDTPRFFFTVCIYNSQLHLINPPDQEAMWTAA